MTHSRSDIQPWNSGQECRRSSSMQTPSGKRVPRPETCVQGRPGPIAGRGSPKRKCGRCSHIPSMELCGRCMLFCWLLARMQNRTSSRCSRSIVRDPMTHPPAFHEAADIVRKRMAFREEQLKLETRAGGIWERKDEGEIMRTYPPNEKLSAFFTTTIVVVCLSHCL